MPLRNSSYDALQAGLRQRPKSWLVTGAAGFIGSHLVHSLLKLDQKVIGFDNFSTGKRANLAEIEGELAAQIRKNFQLIEGDLQNLELCRRACAGADFVLHQAALCSVPASIANPVAAHASNVTGFLHILTAAREAKVQRLVYASSCAVYGDLSNLPYIEEHIGNFLSPYPLSKYMDELYAAVFARNHGFSSVGLRYFNVFGPRQDPDGTYAAVIPKWIDAMVNGTQPVIYGDGKTSRDFCYVEDVVQANLLAALAAPHEPPNQVYNIGTGTRVSLNDLFAMLRSVVSASTGQGRLPDPEYSDFRLGDVRHSHGDISKARKFLGFQPLFSIEESLATTVDWFVRRRNLS